MSNSKFKVEFTLKQHTPIIHFQSDQSGATLRATELKPKFDRFLIEKVFKKDKSQYEKYLIDKDKDALDYKMQIEAVKSNPIKIVNKTYFGNMGKESQNDEYRYAIKINQTFKIHFLTFNQALKVNIEKLFCSFLAVTNFGTRQNKGFGSYYLDKNDSNYKTPLEALEQIQADFIYATYGVKDEKVFEHVEVIYPLIKTGINYPDYPKKVPDPSQGRGQKASYYKSYLFSYMLGKNPSIGNEKRFIKENFFSKKIKSDGVSKKYVRAMLGIGDGIEFKDHERKGKIEYSNPKIERFKSPLTFKIIENQLFIIINNIDNVMFDNEFTFKNQFKNRDEKVIETTKQIKTPAPSDFDIVDFVYSFADYFNNEIDISKSKDKRNIFDEKILSAKNAKFIKASK